MNKKILVLGSCRVQSSLRKYKRLIDNSINLYLFFPLLHTIEQHLQTIKILKSNRKIETDVFDMRWGDAKCCEITKENKVGKRVPIEDIDIYVIEVCGVRNYLCEHGLYLHPFPQIYEKHKKYEIEYSYNVESKLEELNNLLNKKPIILVSNHNIYKKKSRTNLIKSLENFSSKKSNIKFWNPTQIIEKEGIKKCLKNENHFTFYLMKLQSQNILKKIKEL